MQIFDVTHQALEAGMLGSSMRSQALAQNVANINTAGYQRVDADFHASLAQAISDAKQAGGGDVVSASRVQVAQDSSATAVRADGNTVDADQENALVAQNALEFQGVSQLLALRRRELELTMRTTGV